MSCSRNLRRVAVFARRVGLVQVANRTLFFLGAVFRRKTGPGHGPVSLPALDRIKPLRGEALNGACCRQCGAIHNQRNGRWYRIGSRVYCQTCAPAVAQQAGVLLQGALPVKHSTLPLMPVTDQTVLKPAEVKVGMLPVKGYAVYQFGRDTGLRLASTDSQSTWFVYWGRTGQALGGPFASLNEAEGLAGILARLNWNRPLAEFTEADMRGAVRLARAYRTGLVSSEPTG